MQNEIDYTYFDTELNILGNFRLPQCLSSSNDKLSLNLKCITNRNKIMKHIRKKRSMDMIIITIMRWPRIASDAGTTMENEFTNFNVMAIFLLHYIKL